MEKQCHCFMQKSQCQISWNPQPSQARCRAVRIPPIRALIQLTSATSNPWHSNTRVIFWFVYSQHYRCTVKKILTQKLIFLYNSSTVSSSLSLSHTNSSLSLSLEPWRRRDETLLFSLSLPSLSSRSRRPKSSSKNVLPVLSLPLDRVFILTCLFSFTCISII